MFGLVSEHFGVERRGEGIGMRIVGVATSMIGLEGCGSRHN